MGTACTSFRLGSSRAFQFCGQQGLDGINPNKSVVLPVGDVMPIGGAVESRGGYFYLSDVNLLAGPAEWNLSVTCVENGQIVVVENKPTAISPKATSPVLSTEVP